MEKSAVYQKVDTLVAMSRTKSRAEDLTVELANLDGQIKSAKAKLIELEETMTKDKYFDASSEIVDRNIEIGLNKKIKKTKSEQKELTVKSEELKSYTEEFFLEQEILTNQIVDLEESMAAINKRIAAGGEENAITRYNQNLTILEIAKNELVASLNSVNEQLEKAQKEREALDEEIARNQTQIEINEQQLAEVVESLSDGTAYLDMVQKTKDEEVKTKLLAEIDLATTRIKEIEADPIMLGKEAKELLLADDITGALAKMRILVEIVKKIPFMELANDENLQAILADELLRAEAERDSLATTISTKSYDAKGTIIEDRRIAYLNKRINNNEEAINNLKEKITRIDEDQLFEINQEITTLITEISEMDQNHKRLQALIDDETNVTRKKSLIGMAESKKEEIKNATTLLSLYRKEQARDIILASNLQNQEIEKLTAEINSAREEITVIESHKLLTTAKNKDIIAEETDKADLAIKAQVVSDIKHRQNYLASPTELLKATEEYLGTVLNPTPEIISEVAIAEAQPSQITELTIEQPKEIEFGETQLDQDLDIPPLESINSETIAPLGEVTLPPELDFNVEPSAEEIVITADNQTIKEESNNLLVDSLVELESNAAELDIKTPTDLPEQALTNEPLIELPPITETSLDNLNDLFSLDEGTVIEDKVENEPTLDQSKMNNIAIPEVNEEPIDLLDSLNNFSTSTSEPIVQSQPEVDTKIKVTDVVEFEPIAAKPIEQTTGFEPIAAKPIEQTTVSEEEFPAFEATQTVSEQTQPIATSEVKDNVFDFPGQFFGSEPEGTGPENIDNYLNFTPSEQRKVA